MNCDDLETVASDLARGQMVDAALSEKALTHTASCARCATRLADERELTEGLRQFAAATATGEAPPRVEASLIEVFRRERTKAVASAATTPPLQTRRWLYLAIGAAAVVAIVIFLSLSARRTSEPQPQAPQKAGGTVPAQPDSTQQPAVAPASQEKKIANHHATKRSVRTTEPKRPTVVAVDRVEPTAGDVEIATDFIPLMNRESLTQLDSGQVVRVELPRSALMSFGLPMNMERANERVKADVVVGNDGLARAIRFVR